MPYIALARKWRPRTFAELLGQDPIRQLLVNSLNTQRLHHAYLFTGTRGVGKTTIARLLAKALNCVQGISATPCLQCEICKEIEQGAFLDLIEMDAASKTGVEDMRQLLENVPYAPVKGRFKVYLIDEVHMLSNSSFNALLKTLEEPPSHVVFLFATTESQKIPETILSRCLQCHLRPLSPALIGSHLEHILAQENLSVESGVVPLLASAARGSMRDGLSLLDQVIASAESAISLAHVKRTLGYTQQEYIFPLLQALLHRDAAQLLLISQSISEEGAAYRFVLDSLLHKLHDISMLQALRGDTTLFPAPEEITWLAQQFSAEDVQLWYHIALKGLDELSYAPSPNIAFNMVLLRMMVFRDASLPAEAAFSEAAVSAAVVPALPTIVAPAQMSAVQVTSTTATPVTVLPPEPVAPTAPTPITPEIKSPMVPKNALISPQKEEWSSVISHLGLTGLTLNAAEQAICVRRTDTLWTLGLKESHRLLFTPVMLTRIQEALSNYVGHAVQIELISIDQEYVSPAQERKIHEQKVRDLAQDALESDPMFQALRSELSAEVIEDSMVFLRNEL
ncbi:MAG: DNA polymerase III subunit gamma/tau [Legionellaceae bacterium]|nr:DNA polymerase III subunit gamma/tau [Legionellaceae bacterium]